MSDIEDLVKQLRCHLDVAESEIKALKGGRKASSARSRKSLQQLKTGSHALRSEIMNFTKSMPTKTRKPKAEVKTENDELPPPPELKREETNSVKELEVPVKKTRTRKTKAK